MRVVVTWDQTDEDVDVDASVLLLDGGTVRTDEDFVFYNQPVVAGRLGAVPRARADRDR